MRAVGKWLLLVLVAACGETQSNDKIQKITVTKVTPDSGGGTTVATGDEPPVEPTAGTKDDVLARIFDLGTEPTVPSAFGTLRPGMARRDAAKAKPKTWGQEWAFQPAEETDVVLRAGLDDGSDDPIQRLEVELKQRDAVARLAAVWGEPALRAYHQGTVCWLAAGSKLKACHTKDLDKDQILLVTYTPLDEALKKGAPRTPAVAATFLGQGKKDVQRSYGHAIEISDPDDATQHRLEVSYATSELTADVAPDRAVYYLDKSEKVVAIHLWFGANDPAVRAKVKQSVEGALEHVTGDDELMVTMREKDEAAIVVVLDRTPRLQ